MAKDKPAPKKGLRNAMTEGPAAPPTGPPVVGRSVPLADALPTPTFTGVDLAGLASQGRAETNTRIAGQSSLMDSYLEQVLGMKAAEGQAATERDLRMQDFERQQALMREQLQRSRQGQDAALQRARIEAAAAEGLKDRDFRTAMTAEERAFELGQAATQRDSQALQDRLLELQVQQMEQELGNVGGGFGQNVISADRGAELSAGRQDALRGVTFDERTGGGFFNFLPGDQRGTRTVDYGDLSQSALGIVDQYGEDPNEVVRKIRELARQRPQLASLLLHDIGYNPAAFLAPEG